MTPFHLWLSKSLQKEVMKTSKVFGIYSNVTEWKICHIYILQSRFWSAAEHNTPKTCQWKKLWQQTILQNIVEKKHLF